MIIYNTNCTADPKELKFLCLYYFIKHEENYAFATTAKQNY